MLVLRGLINNMNPIELTPNMNVVIQYYFLQTSECEIANAFHLKFDDYKFHE